MQDGMHGASSIEEYADSPVDDPASVDLKLLPGGFEERGDKIGEYRHQLLLVNMHIVRSGVVVRTLDELEKVDQRHLGTSLGSMSTGFHVCQVDAECLQLVIHL